MRVCKNHGSLEDSSFTIRKSGFCPRLCTECERASAREARKRRYATPEGRAVIMRQNAAWRTPKASIPSPLQETTPDEVALFESVRSLGVVPSLRETPELIFDALNKIEISNPLPQSNIGLNYLDNVFSHRFDAKTSGQLSLNEALWDDVQLRKIIRYIIKSGRQPTQKLILRNLQFTCMAPSHFFPSAAAAIMREMTGKDLYDPFLGWGGRTLGAFCSRVRSITGTDLQEKSVNGCMKISSDFSEISSTIGDFQKCDFSQFMQSTDKKFDCVFTSPPFIDTEDYGSGVLSMRGWIESVIIPLVSGCKKVLRPGGRVIIHGQDRKSTPVLSMILGVFASSGFTLSYEYKYGRKPGQSVMAFIG